MFCILLFIFIYILFHTSITTEFHKYNRQYEKEEDQGLRESIIIETNYLIQKADKFFYNVYLKGHHIFAFSSTTARDISSNNYYGNKVLYFKSSFTNSAIALHNNDIFFLLKIKDYNLKIWI